MFRTLQGRLPLEFISAEIRTMSEANIYLKEKLLPEFNKPHTTKAEEDKSAFVPWINNTIMLKEILSIQNERTVNNDTTISYQGKKYQMPESEHRFSYAKTVIKIHEYHDGSISIFHGPRKLASFANKSKSFEVNNL